MRLVELSGTPKDRGLQHGKLLRAEIHALYAAFLDMVAADEPPFVVLTETDVLDYAVQHLPFVEAAAPRLLDEMRGIAEASGLEFEQILAMNCVAEIRRLRWPDVRDRLAAGPDTANGGCTCATVQRDATGGDVLLAQTYDIEPIWTPILFRNAATETTPEALFVGHAGILCQFGMNAAGISVIASALRVDDQRPGVPAPIIARLVLNETRLSSAVEAIILNRRTVGIHYSVGSSFGIVDIETSAGSHAVRYVHEPVHAFSNHMKSADLKPRETAIPSAHTYVREGRMHQLLSEHQGPITADSITGILADHENYPVGICNHVEPGVSMAESRAAVVMNATAGVMFCADGPPCSNRFMRFDLG